MSNLDHVITSVTLRTATDDGYKLLCEQQSWALNETLVNTSESEPNPVHFSVLFCTVDPDELTRTCNTT